jgi:hypothetical protein
MRSHPGKDQQMTQDQMDRILVGIFFTCVSLLAVGLMFACLAIGQSKLDDQPPKSQDTLQEDDPGWDCHEMGNRICGPGHG